MTKVIPNHTKWYIKYNPFAYYFNAKYDKIAKIRQYQKEISELKYTTKVNLQSMISDLRNFNPGIFRRLRLKWGEIMGDKYCMCLIHYPDNIDVIRHFKMPKPFVVEVNDKWYLFSPKAFRFVNDQAKLEFYANTPFAILHNVHAKYEAPTIDTTAYATVQKSKHVIDALKTEPENDMNIWMIVLIIGVVIAIILGIINMTNIGKIVKAMAIK